MSPALLSLLLKIAKNEQHGIPITELPDAPILADLLTVLDADGLIEFGQPIYSSVQKKVGT